MRSTEGQIAQDMLCDLWWVRWKATELFEAGQVCVLDVNATDRASDSFWHDPLQRYVRKFRCATECRLHQTEINTRS
jgi:hypothetical protein